MDPPSIPTPTVSSDVTESCISSQAPPPSSSPFQLLEISLISAQDLTPISKSMQTYAVTWIHPNRKHTSRTDQQGHKNPMWNDKFVFCLDSELILSENATVTVEIYTVSWFRDVLVGMVRVLISDLITPLARTRQNRTKNTRFVALQVRRPSGSPQGILNMGVALLDSTMRSMPLQKPPAKNFQDTIQKKLNSQQKNENQDDDKRELNTKIQLWRSLSAGSSEVNNEDFPVKPGSVYNGSTDKGSELCSDIGPSASIVAAELAKKLQPQPEANPSNSNRRKLPQAEETGSSILEELTIEEAKAKGYGRVASKERWRKPASMDECDESELLWESRRHSRRSSDGGLFSCFGNAYGIEFTIVCGASKNASGNKRSSSSRRKKGSEANSA
ncbi:hypothetical protein Pfo_027077 [Paulownia fortunei]|nr:hypothetical protein Pfo_027077 [Paulownia fortunei]